MYVRVMIFQRGILRKIHCSCIEGGIYNLKKVYSLYYFHLDSTWHESWIIMKWNSNIDALCDVNLSTKEQHKYFSMAAQYLDELLSITPKIP
jgi:hypothetical protein